MSVAEIRFYSHRADRTYAAFSNFSDHAVTIGQHTYPTAEHYFQSRKFRKTDPEYAERIRQAATPAEAKRLGGSRDHPIDPNWDARKERVMERVLRAKFTQHADLQRLLLGTRAATLIEAAPRDYYWGEGASRTGRNRLGVLLMDLRDSMQ
jgi:ribA/ribD-fused uncharacterized protein